MCNFCINVQSFENVCKQLKKIKLFNNNCSALVLGQRGGTASITRSTHLSLSRQGQLH